MPDAFVPLAAILRPPLEEKALNQEFQERSAPAGESLPSEIASAHRDALGAVRRFRAALDDALDLAVSRLLSEIAENVLARELALLPSDVASIVAKARERFVSEGVVAVRLHPKDGDALEHLDVEKVFDAALCAGDMILELRSGSIDLRLRTRLEIALDASAP